MVLLAQQKHVTLRSHELSRIEELGYLATLRFRQRRVDVLDEAEHEFTAEYLCEFVEVAFAVVITIIVIRSIC